MGSALAQVELAGTSQQHQVFFYDGDAAFAAGVADYVASGLADGETVVVIATIHHLEVIEAALSERGTDVPLARAAGSYVALDATQTLDSIMVDGSPDARRLDKVAGVLDAAAAQGTAVRVFGEMVALLWDRGDVPGAIALESSWNDLAQDRPLPVLCAYPTTALVTAGLTEVNEVCQLHSALLPPSSHGSLSSGDLSLGVPAPSDPSSNDLSPNDPSLGDPSSNDSDDEPACARVFVAVPEAVAAARRFVSATLTSWGLEDLDWDGALVMSELATNAIVHGGSPFRASIERARDVVRISVEDAGPGHPHRRLASADALDGRGVAIVEELAQRWGCEWHRDGKVLWAELAARAE